MFPRRFICYKNIESSRSLIWISRSRIRGLICEWACLTPLWLCWEPSSLCATRWHSGRVVPELKVLVMDLIVEFMEGFFFTETAHTHNRAYIITDRAVGKFQRAQTGR